MLYVYIFSDCVECRIEIQLYQEIPPEKKAKNNIQKFSIIYYETRKA